jgi:hypothetical protein
MNVSAAPSSGCPSSMTFPENGTVSGSVTCVSPLPQPDIKTKDNRPRLRHKIDRTGIITALGFSLDCCRRKSTNGDQTVDPINKDSNAESLARQQWQRASDGNVCGMNGRRRSQ